MTERTKSDEFLTAQNAAALLFGDIGSRDLKHNLVSLAKAAQALDLR
jgi:hypothetical protein